MNKMQLDGTQCVVKKSTVTSCSRGHYLVTQDNPQNFLGEVP